MNDIFVEPILATRATPNLTNGLITLRVRVPVYIWTETLTHRRFARNASSSRAQNSARHIGMGHYTPPIFYSDLPGMRVGAELPPEAQHQAYVIWDKAWQSAVHYVEALAEMGVSREQANRLLPTIKMVNGVITGTEDAWGYFLQLRLAEGADTAMQLFAAQVSQVIRNLDWSHSLYHIPMDDGSGNPLTAAARIARVSYSGKSKTDDVDLAKRLLADRHLSPFDHVARYTYLDGPVLSSLNSKPEDFDANGNCWVSYRSLMEHGDEELW